MRVLDKAGIFRLKSMVVMDRTTSRDAFDLWWFVAREGRSVEEVLDAMDERKRHRGLDDLLRMISPARFPPYDPGFQALDPSFPQDREQLAADMARLIADHRRAVARREIAALTKRPTRPPEHPPTSRKPDRGR